MLTTTATSSVSVSVEALRGGDQLLISGRHGEAFRHFESLYLQYGDDANILVGMGISSSALGIHDRAARLLADACLRRQVPQWAIWLTQSWLRLNLPMAAYVLVKAIEASLPERGDLKNIVGELYEKYEILLDDAGVDKGLLRQENCRPAAMNEPEILAQNEVSRMLMRGENAVALDAALRMLELYPKNPYLHQNAGLAAKRMKRFDISYIHYLKALTVAPLMEGAVSNFGNLLLSLQRPVEAFTLLEAGAIFRRADGALWGNLAVAYNALSTAPWEAEYAARVAVSLPNGDTATNWCALAGALTRQGRMQESLNAWDEALHRHPERRFERLFQLHYAENISPEYVANEHKDFGESVRLIASRERTKFQFDFASRNHDRLRIGFVSGDVKSHPVAYFLLPLLSNLDRKKYEIYIYQTAKEDAVSEMFKGYCDCWVNVEDVTDGELALLINKQEVDVLWDLSGHTANNRLVVFASRPAPLQITWLGYPNTTGLTSIDYRITDICLDPVGVESRYTEKLARVSTTMCYSPLIRAPELRSDSRYAVANAPVLRNGVITFGCCNNLAKISSGSIAVWSRILQRLPSSRLLIEAPGLHQREFCRSIIERFGSYGIDSGRLILLPRIPEMQYLRYNDIDIALDPFPYNGGTTSCDLLWMGVPLVTLAGDSCVSRMGVSILTNLGKKQWIAGDRDEYVDVAVKLAGDVDALNLIRLSLRGEMEKSVLMDGIGFAREMGSMMDNLWISCAK